MRKWKVFSLWNIYGMQKAASIFPESSCLDIGKQWVANFVSRASCNHTYFFVKLYENFILSPCCSLLNLSLIEWAYVNVCSTISFQSKVKEWRGEQRGAMAFHCSVSPLPCKLNANIKLASNFFHLPSQIIYVGKGFRT